jgi:putative SOS response-associated peptidase YedK
MPGRVIHVRPIQGEPIESCTLLTCDANEPMMAYPVSTLVNNVKRRSKGISTRTGLPPWP